MATPSVSRRLIGRDAELTELLEALEAARAGRPAVALVAGESGIGKTRLVAEVAAAARATGARVLTGDCIELGDGELPYTPLVGALRPLARAGDPALLALPVAARRELAALLPDLGDEAADPPAPSAREQDRGDAQRRLFEALLAALDRLAHDAPLLLVLEDVHWADRATRDFLAFLGRNLAGERVLVALTFRPDELHRRHPLRPLLAMLERAPAARRLDLVGLGADDVAALAHDYLGAEPAPELVERLVRRSDGNALFVEELLCAGPGPLPQSLADALMVRIERLPRPAQDLLRTLAVAQPADHALLEQLVDLDPGRLREALRDAIAGQVVAVDDDRYTFRHVLLREVVYDDLLPGERSAMHQAVAAGLEQRLDVTHPDARLAAAVAHHFHAAGDQPAALRSAVRAADAARRVHASADAAAMLERALELWDRVPDPCALTGLDHVELLRRAGAWAPSGDDQRRLARINEAIREIRAQAPDDPRVPDLLRERSMAEWSLGRGEASRASLDLARRLLADDAPARERLRLAVARIRLALLQSRFREAIALGDEVLPSLDPAHSDDLALTTDVSNFVGHALIMAGEHDRGVAMMRNGLETARVLGDDHRLGVAYVNLADALQLRGHAEEAAAIVAEGLEEIEGRLESAPWERSLAAELAIDRGDWDAAREHLSRVGPTSAGTRVNVDLRRAELALGVGEHAAARAALEEAELLLVDSLEPQFVAVASVLRAELERRVGSLDVARAAIDAGLERVEFCSDDTVRLGRLALTGVALEADAAQRARDLGDGEGATAAVARAEVMRERVRAAAADGAPLEAAMDASAEGHLLRARDAAPGDAWLAAAATWAALGRPLPAAAARWHHAEACLRHGGDRDAAARALREALTGARGLGAAWLVAELESLAARARLAIGDGTTGEPDAPIEADRDPFGLTPREHQVLALVARGATNREIGGELYMAEKTASVHVSRILAKLDVRSRTEAAAVAHRLGLVGSQP